MRRYLELSQARERDLAISRWFDSMVEPMEDPMEGPVEEPSEESMGEEG